MPNKDALLPLFSLHGALLHNGYLLSIRCQKGKLTPFSLVLDALLVPPHFLGMLFPLLRILFFESELLNEPLLFDLLFLLPGLPLPQPPLAFQVFLSLHEYQLCLFLLIQLL